MLLLLVENEISPYLNKDTVPKLTKPKSEHPFMK